MWSITEWLVHMFPAWWWLSFATDQYNFCVWPWVTKTFIECYLSSAVSSVSSKRDSSVRVIKDAITMCYQELVIRWLHLLQMCSEKLPIVCFLGKKKARSVDWVATPPDDVMVGLWLNSCIGLYSCLNCWNLEHIRVQKYTHFSIQTGKR